MAADCFSLCGGARAGVLAITRSRLIEGNKEDKDCLSPDLKRFQKCSSHQPPRGSRLGNSLKSRIKFFDADCNPVFTLCGPCLARAEVKPVVAGVSPALLG